MSIARHVQGAGRGWAFSAYTGRPRPVFPGIIFGKSDFSQSGAVVAHAAHTRKVAGSIPASASNSPVGSSLDMQGCMIRRAGLPVFSFRDRSSRDAHYQAEPRAGRGDVIKIRAEQGAVPHGCPPAAWREAGGTTRPGPSFQP